MERRGIQSTSTDFKGFLRVWFLDPSSSPFAPHHWDPSYRHMVSLTIAMPMTHSSTSHFNMWDSHDPTVAAHISSCLPDILAWIKEH